MWGAGSALRSRGRSGWGARSGGGGRDEDRRVGGPLGAGRRAAKAAAGVAWTGGEAGDVLEEIEGALVEMIESQGVRVAEEYGRGPGEGGGVAQDVREPDLVDPAAERRVGDGIDVVLLGADHQESVVVMGRGAAVAVGDVAVGAVAGGVEGSVDVDGEPAA